MKIYTQSDIKSEMVERCLAEMYYFAQPSVENIKEAIEKEGDLEQFPFHNKHYLSNESYKYIVEKYIQLYRLEDDFREDCDLLIDNFKEGYNVDKYIEPKDGSPGYRDYDKKPNLATQIGEENAKIVIDIIENRKNFYRFNRLCESFRFTMMNYSPTSNKQTVIDYWKSQGKDIEIVDYNPEYNYERFNLGMSEEEIQELIEEESNE